jgi:hypothetical protein
VFVSQLVSGAFQAPVEVDGGLAGGSSQPVIAAGSGGLELIGFINSGELYAVERPSQAAPFGSPVALAEGASNPSLSITNFGKAYLAFAAADGSGSDVRTAYFYNGRWALEGPALNAAAADDAGTGSGRPDVAAAGDGVAIVVWGEGGHIYSRRVWGTTPSVVYEQADAPPAGCTEASADAPSVGTGGDSSYAPVAFQERVICGGHEQSRVLMNRLHASIYDGIVDADGLSGAPADGADDPQVAMTEYGQGWVTSERSLSRAVFAEMLYDNGAAWGNDQINSLAGTTAPYPVPATAGLYSTLVAWQQDPGSSGPPEIRVRYAPDGINLGAETVLSSPAQGPVDAADGLAAAGDVAGDAAVAWLQGVPGSIAVMAEQLYQAPGQFSVTKSPRYSKASQPVFSWSTPRGWGPMRYSLTIDGAAVGQTYSNSMAAPTPLSDGPHAWQVSAANPAGEQRQARPAGVFVDTVAPRVRLRLRGLRVIGFRLRARLSYADLPPAGEPRSDASGVTKVELRWGDGTTVRLRPGAHLSTHAYRRAGRYRITVLISDRAGNVVRLISTIGVAKSVGSFPAPAPPPRHKGKRPSTGGSKPMADAKPTITARTSK